MPRFVRSICQCGNMQESKGRYKGKTYFGLFCSTCRKNQNRGLYYLKKKHCEICNFESSHPCQIDIDHIDGDHTNNDPSNLQSLCANCHRLKTIQNKDYLAKEKSCQDS